ncbi:hypothetical protein JCM8097_002437 [Rhodosporidiobolus ruineniae]
MHRSPAPSVASSSSSSSSKNAPSFRTKLSKLVPKPCAAVRRDPTEVVQAFREEIHIRVKQKEEEMHSAPPPPYSADSSPASTCPSSPSSSTAHLPPPYATPPASLAEKVKAALRKSG